MRENTKEKNMTDTITPQMLEAHKQELITNMTDGAPPAPVTSSPEEFIKLVKQDKGEFVQTEADVGGSPL